MLIHIWHPKGGTGKTTVAVSLAVALSRSWGRALYVEIGPVPLGVKLLGVPPDGQIHRGRGGVLAVYAPDVEKAQPLFTTERAMAVVADYPPCIKPEEGGLLLPVADWLSASTLEAFGNVKIAVLNKDRGWESKLPTPYELVRLPHSYAVERAVAEGVPPVLVKPLSSEHRQFVEGVKRLADRIIELAGVKK
ncbi:MAG: hypothetical protein QXK62_06845 [Thermoproteus sp.]